MQVISITFHSHQTDYNSPMSKLICFLEEMLFYMVFVLDTANTDILCNIQINLPAYPGAQIHVAFSPSLSQVPPFWQLMLMQGSLYNSQCLPEWEKLVTAVNFTHADSLKSEQVITSSGWAQQCPVVKPTIKPKPCILCWLNF